MSVSLNNVATQNGYAAATTLVCPTTKRVNINVSGAAIFYQRGEGVPPSFFESETMLTPSIYSLDRDCDGVRVRSAVAGVPAQVTIEMLTGDEIGAGDSDS